MKTTITAAEHQKLVEAERLAATAREQLEYASELLVTTLEPTDKDEESDIRDAACGCFWNEEPLSNTLSDLGVQPEGHRP
jgi:hypothetical protein